MVDKAVFVAKVAQIENLPQSGQETCPSNSGTVQ